MFQQRTPSCLVVRSLLSGKRESFLSTPSIIAARIILPVCEVEKHEIIADRLT